MSVSTISDPVKFRLWGKAAGCCQYENCSKPLYIDQLTKAEFNTAYIAHIYADQPGGPRYDKNLSPRLQSDISNLMLLCDDHHRLIDKAQVKEHSPERLIAMKQLHERRMAIITQVQSSKASHILLYGANIGAARSPLNYREAASVIIATHVPAADHAIELGMKNASLIDNEPQYWNIESLHLKKMFNRYVEPLKGNDMVQHFSIFALAPQPLLIQLGSMLSDLYHAEVYQRHREPACWNWQDDATLVNYTFERPIDTSGIPALILQLSGTIVDDRVYKATGVNTSIWKISIDTPDNDFLKNRGCLQAFRRIARHALDTIKATHGEDASIHIFPAMPVAAAVEFGRIWMPKADLPLIIYDQNRITGGFTTTITIKQENLCYQ